MPHIDKRTGQVVIRVVYDGAPEAGKTTNIQELAKGMSLSRRSEVVSPRSTSRRTEFFDWLTFTGGFVDGRRLGCQLVSVPGQPSLLRRRRYLLDSADVVVFVADARPELTSLNRELFDWMRSMLEKRRVHAVVQANKQDLQSSLRPHDLASALGLSDGTPILGASAALGEGVMQTFITAVRLGTARVLELVTSGGWDGLSPQEESAQDLLAALETAEAELFAQQVELDRARKLDTRGEPAHAPDGDAPIGARLEPPTADVIAAGHVWPLVEGRTTFAEIGGGRPRHAAQARRWARGALETEVLDGERARWVLHTQPEWLFEDAGAARLALITLVRRLRSLEPFLPPGRALSLCDAGAERRLWMSTELVPTLRERLDVADADRLPGLVADLEAALRACGERGQVRVDAPLLDAVAASAAQAFVLALPSAGEGAHPLADLERQLTNEIASRESLGIERAWVARHLAAAAFSPSLTAALERWLAGEGPR